MVVEIATVSVVVVEKMGCFAGKVVVVVEVGTMAEVFGVVELRKTMTL